MTRIIHLSDLHFGTEIPAFVQMVLEVLHDLNGDLIVITGDSTQRALHRQYKKAVAFIERLPKKKIIIVPGNHDISLHNLVERFCYPYKKYKRYLSDILDYTYVQDNLALLALNSTTPKKVKNGYIKPFQLDLAHKFFSLEALGKVKIALMHHNLIHSERHRVIENAEEVICAFGEAGVNLILSGHLHYPCIEQLKRPNFQQNMYVVTAGTAISHRAGKHLNSFNVIDIDEANFTLKVMEISDKGVMVGSESLFYF